MTVCSQCTNCVVTFSIPGFGLWIQWLHQLQVIESTKDMLRDKKRMGREDSIHSHYAKLVPYPVDLTTEKETSSLAPHHTGLSQTISCSVLNAFIKMRT